MRSYNPSIAETTLVWAIPVSLATTQGIIVIFFSSWYLDVSVPRVCRLSTSRSSIGRVAPFGNLHLEGYLRLSAAYRSLSRPSSLLRAKASSICPLLLIHILTLSIYQRTFSGNPEQPRITESNRMIAAFRNLSPHR